MRKTQSLKSARKQSRANERYARLAMSSLDHCNRSIEQLRAISALIATIVRNPAVTDDERRIEHTLLSLLMATVEGYEREAESHYPRDRYWDAFARHSGVPTIHFKDIPAMAGLECPDGAHLDQKDQTTFTAALARALRAKGML